MAPVVHSYDPPDRFVAGTVGEPGERTFFLQARGGNRLTSIALEKQQVAALGERMGELLDEVMSGEQATATIPAVAPYELVDSDPLEQPIEEQFRAGTMTLSWHGEDERVVVEVFPFTEESVIAPGQSEEEISEPEPEEMLLVRMDAGAARAFCQRVEKVIGAGRPECPFCGEPVDPEGHLCVRANGFRRRDP